VHALIRDLGYGTICEMFPHEAKRGRIDVLPPKFCDSRFMAYIDFPPGTDIDAIVEANRFIRVCDDPDHDGSSYVMTLFRREPREKLNIDDNMVVIDLMDMTTKIEDVYAALVAPGRFGKGSIHRMIRVDDWVCVQFARRAAYNKAVAMIENEPYFDLNGIPVGIRHVHDVPLNTLVATGPMTPKAWWC
jgi:hypothetical protein